MAPQVRSLRGDRAVEHDPAVERADGIAADVVKNAPALTGIDRVLPFEALTAQLAGIAGRAKVLYTPFRPENHGISTRVSGRKGVGGWQSQNQPPVYSPARWCKM